MTLLTVRVKEELPSDQLADPAAASATPVPKLTARPAATANALTAPMPRRMFL
ncbi:hypothetical protein [Rhodococcus sp. IEGM 1379]|uniref:hypothetical protein n=1 Tax=Rhodococcus sp. IEGM 1379 TaxID=3047086 RepID=UPI0024B77C4C|nr:hypothetical protein [Rhodococcus sp. IEGM 1379]MDI9915226.1 hypothetical protein [Rhodococcus sp. IEGM 1379]